MNKPPHFLLVGNGPFLNRGCEAIVRGTMAILRRSFGDDITVTAASFGNPEDISRQAATETDPAITHLCLSSVRRWSLQWFVLQGHFRLGLPYHLSFPMLKDAAKETSMALEIGGDNYTLDYGIPRQFLALDKYLMRRDIPIALWGASVGPFEEAPQFVEPMLVHLRSLAALYVRESTTLEYLRQRDVISNVYEVADPAFALEPVAPAPAIVEALRPEGAVGLNVSPLLARYVGIGDRQRWVSLCAATAARLCRETDRDVVLIPHVTSQDPAADDHLLLEETRQSLQPQHRERVRCAPATLTAAETKWLIAQCGVFIGARTHATIAALSSCVPTVSLVYSNKGRGLNDDLLGTRDFCVEPGDLSPERVVECARQALQNAEEIRQVLAQNVPPMVQRAFAAGDLLKQLMADRGGRRN